MADEKSPNVTRAPLTRSPAVAAFDWLRGSLRSPSPVALVLIGATLPFLGGLVGYVHQENLAAGQARQAQTLRNQQQAGEVFTEISKRLSTIRVIEGEFDDAENSGADTTLNAKVNELASAVREWTLNYPRVRALGETYYGKPLGDYLDAIDGGLRSETNLLPTLARAEIEARRSHLKSDSSLKLFEAARQKVTPEMIRALPPALREHIAWRDAKMDSQQVQIKALDKRRLEQRDTTAKLRLAERAQDARVYKIMSSQIRDGLVGFTDEEREKALAQDTVLGQLGIHPFDLGTVFFGFSFLAVAAIAAYRLAVLTGRYPWPWTVGAVILPAPVLLFLALASPPRPKVISEPEVYPKED